MMEAGHHAHDAMTILAILLYMLGVVSGIRTLYALRQRSDFSLRSVGMITLGYLKSVLTDGKFKRAADGKAWGVIWVVVCLSTFTSAVFFIKNIEYFMDGGSRILGLYWAMPWAAAHVAAGTASFLTHAVVHATAQNTPEII
jgi:hypothetical protein